MIRIKREGLATRLRCLVQPVLRLAYFGQTQVGTRVLGLLGARHLKVLGSFTQLALQTECISQTNAGFKIFGLQSQTFAKVVTADPKLPDFSRNERAFSSAPVFF